LIGAVVQLIGVLVQQIDVAVQQFDWLPNRRHETLSEGL
jgi:hypothetical protein